MKINRIMWGLVVLVVAVTISISLGAFGSRSQEKPKEPLPASAQEDLSRFAVADYDAPEPSIAREAEERRKKGRRYDNWGFVKSNPSTDLFGATTRLETPPPDAIPAAESTLILLGNVTSVNAYLSPDKENVYSEYEVKLNDVLKNDEPKRDRKTVTIDRVGGFVRYSNGHKMLYTVKGQDLPIVGQKYLFFLNRKDDSPNYQIITGYELKETDVRALDRVANPRHEASNKSTFIQAVRSQISQFK